jgi:hypothetical protein
VSIGRERRDAKQKTGSETGVQCEAWVGNIIVGTLSVQISFKALRPCEITQGRRLREKCHKDRGLGPSDINKSGRRGSQQRALREYGQ